MDKMAEIRKEADSMDLDVVDVTDRAERHCFGCVGDDDIPLCGDAPVCSYNDENNRKVHLIFIRKNGGNDE